MIRELLNKIKFQYLFWKESKNLEKAFKDCHLRTDRPIDFGFHEDQAQAALAEGLRRVKNKVQIDKLTEGYDFVDLAANEEGQEKADLLKEIFVTPEIPLEPMIDKRIQDYYELQAHIKRRAELRRKRKLN